MTSEFCLRRLPGAAASAAKEAGDELFIGGRCGPSLPERVRRGEAPPVTAGLRPHYTK